MTIRRLFAAVAAPVAIPALAHEGHAHGGEEPKPVIAMAAPTLETSSSDLELMAVVCPARGPFRPASRWATAATD